MLLKGMLTKAVEWKYLIASPAVGVRAIKDSGRRTRILTPEEQQALLAAYDIGRRRHVRPIIELLLITGARLGEVFGLRWEDTTGGFLRFVDTKNGRPRRLPITPPMAALLAAVPRRDPIFVFVSGRSGTRYTRILTGFKAAVADAGIHPANVVIHTLRHTALSRMMDAGLDVRTIMEISGHRSLAMLERYTHPTEQRKAEALNTYGMVTNRAHSADALAKSARNRALFRSRWRTTAAAPRRPGSCSSTGGRRSRSSAAAAAIRSAIPRRRCCRGSPRPVRRSIEPIATAR